MISLCVTTHDEESLLIEVDSHGHVAIVSLTTKVASLVHSSCMTHLRVHLHHVVHESRLVVEPGALVRVVVGVPPELADHEGPADEGGQAALPHLAGGAEVVEDVLVVGVVHHVARLVGAQGEVQY